MNDDIIAWKNNKKFNWIYLKSNICELQDIEWWPCPIIPEKFPCVMRPLINLGGMGAEVYFINNVEEFEENSCYGYFSTPFITGIHTSHDFDVSNGELINETIFEGIPNKDYPGTFKYWELKDINRKPIIFKNLKKLKNKLKNYTGSLNIECINNIIIECHLRRGDSNIINKLEKPLFIVPIWGALNENEEIDIENIKRENGVIDVFQDSEYLSKTGYNLQRKGLVITKILPDNLKLD